MESACPIGASAGSVIELESMGRKARITLPDGSGAGVRLAASIPARFDPDMLITAVVLEQPPKSKPAQAAVRSPSSFAPTLSPHMSDNEERSPQSSAQMKKLEKALGAERRAPEPEPDLELEPEPPAPPKRVAKFVEPAVKVSKKKKKKKKQRSAVAQDRVVALPGQPPLPADLPPPPQARPPSPPGGGLRA